MSRFTLDSCACGAPLDYSEIVVLKCSESRMDGMADTRADLLQNIPYVAVVILSQRLRMAAISAISWIPLKTLPPPTHRKAAIFESIHVDLSPCRLLGQHPALDSPKHTPTTGEKKRKADDTGYLDDSPLNQSPCQNRKRMKVQGPAQINRIEEKILVSRVNHLKM